MSYTPENWQTGDTITAAKLNHMEQGIASAGGALIVNITLTQDGINRVMDKTWIEIYSAIQVMPVSFVVTEDDGDYNYVSLGVFGSMFYDGGVYYITVSDNEYTTSTESGYPITNWEV